MFNNIDISHQLKRLHSKVLSQEDQLLHQANVILKQDIYSEKHILENLSGYIKSFEELPEELLEKDHVFHPSEIKKLAILYRLKFLESNYYKSEIPYDAILKIRSLNRVNRIEIKAFKILSPAENFGKENADLNTLLFAKTKEDNFYLIHYWGKNLKWYRKWLYLPLQSFENLVTTVFLTTLILTLSLPTELITLDNKAEYWSGYRAATFFHLLIFNFGVTVFFTFTLAKNFSNAIWNQYKDF